jgi:ABC-type taurine transport system ATPase subunit
MYHTPGHHVNHSFFILSLEPSGCSKTLICCVSLVLPFGKLRAGSVSCHGEPVEPSGALHLNVFEQPDEKHVFNTLQIFLLKNHIQRIP